MYFKYYPRTRSIWVYCRTDYGMIVVVGCWTFAEYAETFGPNAAMRLIDETTDDDPLSFR